jgi:hypothetical protein
MSCEKNEMGGRPRCSFGILADNQCANLADWLSTFEGEPTGAAWCEEHKPTWIKRPPHGLERLGPELTENQKLFHANGRGGGHRYRRATEADTPQTTLPLRN